MNSILLTKCINYAMIKIEYLKMTPKRKLEFTVFSTNIR